MNLKEFLSINSKMTSKESNIYSFVQLAYEDVVNKIRLEQHMFPVIMQKAFKCDRLKTKFDIGNNKIAFKEIRTLNNSTIINPIESNEDIGTLEVFSFDPGNFHGIGEVRFDAVNEDHETVPELEIKGDIVQCSNITGDVFFFIYGYPYPYFAQPALWEDEAQDPYDIAAMVTLYGEEYLVVDDVLALLMIPKILSIYESSENNVSMASSLDYIYMQILNRYNATKELFRSNSFQMVSTIPFNG